MTKEVLLTFIGDTRVPYCTLVNNFEDFYHRSWKIVNLEQNKSFYKNFSKNLLHIQGITPLVRKRHIYDSKKANFIHNLLLGAKQI